MKGLAYLSGLWDYPYSEIPREHVRKVLELFLQENKEWNEFNQLLKKLRQLEKRA